MNYVYDTHGKIEHSHMGELKTPRLPFAPTKISHLQATKVAGLTEHTAEYVEGQVPQMSSVPEYTVPMPKLPDHLVKVAPPATKCDMGHIKMEMRDHKGISLVYIG